MYIDDVIPHVTDMLHDAGMVTWKKEAVVRAIDMGIKTVCIYRPDASTSLGELTLVPGVDQELPTDYQRLLDSGFNMDGTEATNPIVRLLSMDSVDEFMAWYDEPESDVIHEVYYNENNPDRFKVYPPAEANTKIKMVVSVVPAETVVADTHTTVFPLGNKYLPMVVDWALSRLFGADKPESPNYGRGVDHRNNFFNLMGIKIQSDRSAAKTLLPNK